MAQWPNTRMTLLERLQDHEDQVAWQEFVDLYGPLVYGFARKRLPQDLDAADVMQDVLLAFANGGYDPQKGRFHKWLLTVILNKVRDAWSQRQRSPPPVGGTDFQLELQEVPDEVHDDWEQQHRERLWGRALELVRDEIQPAHWQVFRMSAVEGKTGKEVAEALGLRVSNVWSIKSRILSRIKEIVEQFEGSYGDSP